MCPTRSLFNGSTRNTVRCGRRFTSAPGDCGRRPKRDRSAPEPGEESQDVGWMEGLSSRLSAYSLDGDDEPTADAESDHEPEDAETGT